jgi:8-oxo-dGTP pyrophosphatase MutT (NUDIX family)
MRDKNSQFIKNLRIRLKKIDYKSNSESSASDLKDAAVLVPIIKKNKEYKILFTKRTNLVESHPNQISFPGGVIEENDKDLLDTCYRETEEEIGLHKDKIDILGELEAKSTSTGYHIHSFVGFLKSIEHLKINHDEVERVIFIPIRWLVNPENSYTELFVDKRKQIHNVISYKMYKGEKLWGVTASIVMQLLDIV